MSGSHEQRWLNEVLTRQIPLGAAMQLEIDGLDDQGIRLAVPLAPNINDKGTAFGGAMMSLMTLAGWSLPRLALRRADLHAELVIGRCEVRFLQPVDTAFAAVCSWPAKERVETFLEDVRIRGKGRLELAPEIVVEGPAGVMVAARLEARYAGLAVQP